MILLGWMKKLNPIILGSLQFKSNSMNIDTLHYDCSNFDNGQWVPQYPHSSFHNNGYLGACPSFLYPEGDIMHCQPFVLLYNPRTKKSPIINYLSISVWHLLSMLTTSLLKVFSSKVWQIFTTTGHPWEYFLHILLSIGFVPSRMILTS